MDQKDEMEFSFSDIMKELSQQAPPAPLIGKKPEESEAPQSEAPQPEAEEPVVADTGENEAQEPVPSEEVEEILISAPQVKKKRWGRRKKALEAEMEDTIRLDAIRSAVAAQTSEGEATPVQTEKEPDPQATVAFPHIQPGSFGEQEVERETSETPEPFSEEWEPDFRESMEEDFPIPEPVIHRPKSRLKELRQKLVEGPEKRYYALSEQGVGKLQVALIVNGLLLLLMVAVTVIYALGGVPENRLRLMVFGQFLTMMLSALLGCYQMIEGVTDLFRLRFTPNTLLVVTFLICCLDGVLCLQQLRISVCAAFSLQMTMALWAAFDRRNTEMGQMDTLRRATNLNGLACVPDDYEGMTGFRICRGEVEHFMDHYSTPSKPERLLNWYSLTVAVISLALGGLCIALHGLSTGVQLCCASLMIGMPATAFLSTVRPMEVLEKRLHRLGTVLCGWQGVEAVRCRIAVPLNDKDLFPAGSVKLNGVKFYGDRNPDQVVTYTSALISANGGALVELFEQLRDSRGGKLCLVDNLHIYTGGVGGEIGEDCILVGTLQFMQDMGVDVGRGTRVSQAVYTAIDGELCGVFAVSYGRAKSSAAGVRTLFGCRSLVPVMTTKDFMITESFIRSKFTVSTRRVSFPDRDTCVDICARSAPEGAKVVALTTKEGLAPMAFAITGARALGSAMQMGVLIHMIGGILGLIIMSALAYIGSAELLTPLNVLLYQLLWMIPGLLVTEWTRTL